jgi:hypothetical protein
MHLRASLSYCDTFIRSYLQSFSLTAFSDITLLANATDIHFAIKKKKGILNTEQRGHLRASLSSCDTIIGRHLQACSLTAFSYITLLAFATGKVISPFSKQVFGMRKV